MPHKFVYAGPNGYARIITTSRNKKRSATRKGGRAGKTPPPNRSAAAAKSCPRARQERKTPSNEPIMPEYRSIYDDDVQPLPKETRGQILKEARLDRRLTHFLRNLEYEARDVRFVELWSADKATKRWSSLVQLAGRRPRIGSEFLAVWLIGVTDGSREVVSRCVDELARLEKVVGGPGSEVKAACARVWDALRRRGLPNCCDFTDLEDFLRPPTPPKS